MKDVISSFAARRPAVVLAGVWACFAVAAILMLSFGNLIAFGVGVPVAAIALAAICARLGVFRNVPVQWVRWKLDKADVAAVVVLYAAVVGLFKVGFGVFGTSNMLWFFLAFAAAMLIGVVGPIVYVVWIRHRSMSVLGIGLHNFRATVLLALVFAGAQVAVTLWGLSFPAAVDWVPLLMMSLTVGAFEAVFFRGFIQGTLEPVVGAAPALAAAAALYALYHVGYGMGLADMVFLFGLGVVYTIAYRITANLLAIWPLLTPLGGFFNQLKSGDLAGQLPWISILGFADILAVMVIAIWLTARFRGRRYIKTRPVPA